MTFSKCTELINLGIFKKFKILQLKIEYRNGIKS